MSGKYNLSFANGGIKIITPFQRGQYEKLGITLEDGLGDKIQSSSWLLKNKFLEVIL